MKEVIRMNEKRENHYANAYDVPADIVVHRMKANSCTDADAARLADSLAHLRGAEAEEKKAEAVKEKNKTDFWGKVFDCLATVMAGLAGGLAMVAVAKVRTKGHIDAIDHVAFYEDADVIFTGKKMNETGKID